MGVKWAKQEIPGAQAPQQKVKEALKMQLIALHIMVRRCRH